jgi:hypothetical protein
MNADGRDLPVEVGATTLGGAIDDGGSCTARRLNPESPAGVETAMPASGPAPWRFHGPTSETAGLPTMDRTAG